MTRDSLVAALRSAEPELRAHGTAALYLFGSYSRGEAGEGSDIDLFIDKAPGRPFGLDELMGSYRALRQAVPGLDVHFGTREGLSKYARAAIEREAIRIF